MRSEDFKCILLAMLIILSLLTLIIFLGNTSLEIVHASPEGGSDNKPIQVKVKIFVLENRVITDNVIDARMAEANDALRNSGIRLIRGPIYRGFPGNARSRAARDNVRKKVNENLIAENFKGIALIIAPEKSINDNENILGIAKKSKRESAIVADNAGTGMGIKAWAHEIGHVLCLDDLEDNENNIMNSYDPCTENQRFSPKQMENMKKKAENENLNLGIKENNENRLPCTSAIDTIGDVENKWTGDPAPDPGGIDICSVNTPFLSLETIGVEIISMSLMGRGDNLHLYYGLGLNTDDNLDTGGLIEGLPGYDRIVHISLDDIFPFKPPTGSSKVEVLNVENNVITYVGPAEIHTFVETTRLLNPGPGIHDNVMDGVWASIPLDLLGPMADNVPAIAVAMDLVNEVKDTLTFICKATVPPAPWMSISSRTGKPGDNIQIMGGGFPAESFFDVFVTLALGGTEVEVAHTALDENGKFATTFEVPNLPPDNYFLTAIDNEFNSVFLMFEVEPMPWTGTATIELENLYAVTIDLDGDFSTGENLVAKFYTYGGGKYQDQTVVCSENMPGHVTLLENVSRPGKNTIQRVKLVLVDSENNDLWIVKIFESSKTDLMGRLGDIDMYWPFASLEEKTQLMAELGDIDLIWPFAPLT